MGNVAVADSEIAGELRGFSFFWRSWEDVDAGGEVLVEG